MTCMTRFSRARFGEVTSESNASYFIILTHELDIGVVVIEAEISRQ